MSLFSAPVRVVRPSSLAEALAALADEGTVLAGGTWLMRSHLRDETLNGTLVAVRDLAELAGAEASAAGLSLGAALTHRQIAALEPHPAIACIREAARTSAFPQVRNVATLGGNVANAAFPEADLVPALLAAEASVQLATPTGPRREKLSAYLQTRGQRPREEIITRVVVPTPRRRLSAFERITVRKSGEYPLANLAVSVDLEDGVVGAARVAIGSVEAAPRLVPEAADALRGRAVGDIAATAAAVDALAQGLVPREGIDGPAWYRASVTPVLMQRVLRQLENIIA